MAKKKKERTEPLNDFETSCLQGAIRYYMPRRTISSATFPEDFIKEKVYNLISEHTLSVIVDDLDWYIKQFESFGDPNIDDPVWKKFQSFLRGRLKGYEKVELVNGEVIEVFRASFHQLAHQVHNINTGEIINIPEGTIERIYPLKEYCETPWSERYVPKENIKKYLTHEETKNTDSKD
jgi:hypothetical protein